MLTSFGLKGGEQVHPRVQKSQEMNIYMCKLAINEITIACGLFCYIALKSWFVISSLFYRLGENKMNLQASAESTLFSVPANI